MEKSENTFGVTETLEAIAFAEAAYEELSKMLQSGNKPTAARVLLALFSLSPQLQQAIKGFESIDDELKNLNRDEFTNKLGPALTSLAYEIYRDIIQDVK